MSGGTHIGGECDDQLEGCTLRMDDRSMDWDVIYYDGVMFFHPPALRGKGSNVCQSIDIRKGGCSPHHFLPHGGIVRFLVKRFHFSARECLRLNSSFGSVA